MKKYLKYKNLKIKSLKVNSKFNNFFISKTIGNSTRLLPINYKLNITSKINIFKHKIIFKKNILWSKTQSSTLKKKITYSICKYLKLDVLPTNPFFNIKFFPKVLFYRNLKQKKIKTLSNYLLKWNFFYKKGNYVNLPKEIIFTKLNQNFLPYIHKIKCKKPSINFKGLYNLTRLISPIKSTNYLKSKFNKPLSLTTRISKNFILRSYIIFFMKYLLVNNKSPYTYKFIFKKKLFSFLYPNQVRNTLLLKKKKFLFFKLMFNNNFKKKTKIILLAKDI